MSSAQLQTLLAQKKYRQAIDEIKKIQRSQPDFVCTPSEAELWRLRGQQELEKSEFKAAENSFRQALKLGLVADIHYWLAKTLLAQNQLDAALELISIAFEHKTLPKDDGICYFKLLLIKGDRAAVESLIKTQPKRFSTAQLSWAKGVLELQAGDPRSAVPHFSKLKKPLTPGDSIDAWMTYTLQQQGNWDAAGLKLGFGGMRMLALFSQPKFPSHPALQKLAMLQQAVNGDGRQTIVPKNDRAAQEVLTALSAVKLMAEGNFHDAGHAILKLTSASPRIAELIALKSTILTIAGEQAMTQGRSDSAIALWQPLMQAKELDPKLAVNFSQVLDEAGEYQERQRLLTRLIKWIEQDAKKNPTTWPEDRLNRTLAHAHCAIADCAIALGRHRVAVGAVEQAARICPTSAEVFGRQGLIAFLADNPVEAIDLFVTALDGGCQFIEVYKALQQALIETNRKQEILEIRKRYGKNFGDLQIEAEINIEPWIESLSTHDYDSFSRSLPSEKSTEPTLRACQIFKESATGKSTSTGKISIDQAKATTAWDKLLKGLTAPQQLPVLQAIVLSIEVLSKRDKGIAALSTAYMLKIVALIPAVPEAQAIHLIVLAIKENNPAKLELPLKLYLAAAPQPGNALASLQLQVRWFAQKTSLRSFIETSLSHEPQNPLLLLAKATTFLPHSKPYDESRSAGFELARRLQDAKALQAFRVEDYYLEQQRMQSFGFDDDDDFEVVMPAMLGAALEEMIRETFGKRMSRAELDRLMPILKQKFLNDMPGLSDDSFDDDDFEDDDDIDLDAIFGSPNTKKRKRTFMDL